MTLVTALVGIPPRRSTALVERYQEMSAGVAEGEGDLGVGQGLHVLVAARLGFWVGVVMSSHVS